MNRPSEIASAPPPSSISEAARQFLANQRPPAPYPPPEDLKAWSALLVKEAELAIAQIEPTLHTQPYRRETVTFGETSVHVIHPNEIEPVAQGKAVVFFHGGELVFGSGVVALSHAGSTALRLGAVTYGIDYRVPPDHPFPAALDDCLAVYRELLKRNPALSLAFVGTSAGANLAAATVVRALGEGLPAPGALILEWPMLDLTESGDTFRTNQPHDQSCASTANCNALYAGGHDLKDPLVSPLFADLTGFPPTLIITGTRDIMLSNAVRMHRALRRAGVACDLNVWEAAPHGGFGGQAPEGVEMIIEARRFLSHMWRRPATGGPPVQTSQSQPLMENPHFRSPYFWGVANSKAFNESLDRLIQSATLRAGWFASDNLIAFGRNLGFLDDAPLMKAWQAHAKTPAEVGLLWRTATVIWAARQALKLEGGMVDCGCYKGTTARILIDAVDVGDRDYFLYDLFDHDSSMDHHAMPEHSSELFSKVQKRFVEFPNIRVIPGALPTSFSKGLPDQICFAHIDLNNAPAEIGVLDTLEPRFVPGAVIVLDDYGALPYRAQHDAEKKWFADRGREVLELPTSQGIAIW